MLKKKKSFVYITIVLFLNKKKVSKDKDKKFQTSSDYICTKILLIRTSIT